MKIDRAALVGEPLQAITFCLPASIIETVDRAASNADVSCPNRSAWLRSAVLGALRKDAHV
jgi:hypothetical protein